MDSSISHSPSHTQCNQNPSSSLPFPLTNRVQPPTITTRGRLGDLYPTTFVEADSTYFKQVVQMLTGPSKPANPTMTQTYSIPPIKSIVPKKHHHHHQHQHRHQHSSVIKLYERRNSMNRSNVRPSESNVRPCLDMEEEEKAIKEKGFFLHPSPISTPRNSKPHLLPLFPISPRDSSR